MQMVSWGKEKAGRMGVRTLMMGAMVLLPCEQMPDTQPIGARPCRCGPQAFGVANGADLVGGMWAIHSNE